MFFRQTSPVFALWLTAASVLIPLQAAQADTCTLVPAGVTLPLSDASNAANLACGNGAQATGDQSTAIGTEVEASGAASSGLGNFRKCLKRCSGKLKLSVERT